TTNPNPPHKKPKFPPNSPPPQLPPPNRLPQPPLEDFQKALHFLPNFQFHKHFYLTFEKNAITKQNQTFSMRFWGFGQRTLHPLRVSEITLYHQKALLSLPQLQLALLQILGEKQTQTFLKKLQQQQTSLWNITKKILDNPKPIPPSPTQLQPFQLDFGIRQPHLVDTPLNSLLSFWISLAYLANLSGEKQAEKTFLWLYQQGTQTL
ncbi:MAG: hypothetical protein D6805_05050, partial [Planctomycetota bacterium]